MGGTKRKEPTSPLQAGSRKNPRHAPYNQDAAGCSLTARRPASLNTLPTELLCAIFRASLEPAFLHTNRRIWNLTKRSSHGEDAVLPSCPEFKRKIAVLALCSGSCDFSNMETHGWNIIHDVTEIMSSHAMPQAGLQCTIETPLTPEKRSQLQSAVLTSEWFGDQEFERAHTTLLRDVLFRSVQDPRLDISSPQKREIKRFLRQASPVWNTRRNLSMDLRQHAGEYVKLSATAFRVSLGPFSYDIDDVEQRREVLNFQQIPSEFLRLPLTSAKVRMLLYLAIGNGPLCMHSSSPHNLQSGFGVDVSLFEKALEHAITKEGASFGSKSMLLSLLRLGNCASQFTVSPEDQAEMEIDKYSTPHLYVIKTEHVRAAIMSGNLGCLSIMINTCPRFLVLRYEELRHMLDGLHRLLDDGQLEGVKEEEAFNYVEGQLLAARRTSQLNRMPIAERERSRIADRMPPQSKFSANYFESKIS